LFGILKRNKAHSILQSPIYDNDINMGKQASLLLKEAAGVFDYIANNYKSFELKGDL
jgi:hypothetical protein